MGMTSGWLEENLIVRVSRAHYDADVEGQAKAVSQNLIRQFG